MFVTHWDGPAAQNSSVVRIDAFVRRGETRGAASQGGSRPRSPGRSTTTARECSLGYDRRAYDRPRPVGAGRSVQGAPGGGLRRRPLRGQGGPVPPGEGGHALPRLPLRLL